MSKTIHSYRVVILQLEFLIFLRIKLKHFFGCTMQHVGSQFPDQGSNVHPLRQKCGVLSTELPWKSPKVGLLAEEGKKGTFRKNCTKWQFLPSPGLFSIYAHPLDELIQPYHFKMSPIIRLLPHLYFQPGLVSDLQVCISSSPFVISTRMLSKHPKCDMPGTDLLISFFFLKILFSANLLVSILKTGAMFSHFSPPPPSHQLASSPPQIRQKPPNLAFCFFPLPDFILLITQQPMISLKWKPAPVTPLLKHIKDCFPHSV